MSNDLVAIDISHWQPDPIDFQKVWAAGIVGVIHKATESTGYVDDKLFSRAKAALAAGLKWSTYHFLRPGDMKAQMDFYLKTINPVPGERVCLDHEDTKVSLADLKEAVGYLIADPRKLQVTIYSGHVIKDQLPSNGVDTYLAANTSLWLAQYSSTPSWPKGTWPQWSLWQYTDKASVPGVTGAVDGDRFNGSRENCAKWFGPTTDQPQPGPTPEPDRRVVQVSISTPDDVDVEVLVNGELVS